MSKNKQLILPLVISLLVVVVQIVHSIQLKNHPALDNAPYCGSISRPKTKARIQGGAKTKHDSFPSFIFLSMRQMVRGNIDEKECGSVLIGKRYLLTSASCLMRPDMRRKITSGTAWITNQKAERKGSFTGIGISIQAFCVPASYRRDPYNKLYYDDVAVVKLSENLVFNSTVLPACISKTRCSNCSSNYKLPGFGRTLDYPRLQRLDLDDPISVRKSRKSRAGRDLKYIDLTELDCEEPFNSEFLCLAATDMTQSSSAACKGDEGGPVIALENGVNYVRGIVTDLPDKTCSPGRSRITYATRVDNQLETIRMLLDECKKIGS